MDNRIYIESILNLHWTVVSSSLDFEFPITLHGNEGVFFPSPFLNFDFDFMQFKLLNQSKKHCQSSSYVSMSS